MPTTEAEQPVAENPESSLSAPSPQSFADSGASGATSVGALASAELQEVELSEVFGNYYGPLPKNHVKWLRDTGSESKFEKYIEDTFNISKGIGTQQEFPGVYKMSDVLTQLFQHLAREARKARPNRAVMMEIRKELVEIMKKQSTTEVVHEQAIKKYEQERTNAIAMQKRTKGFEQITKPIRGSPASPP